MMLSRPSDSGHTPFGDIFLSESQIWYTGADTDMSWAKEANGGSP